MGFTGEGQSIGQKLSREGKADARAGAEMVCDRAQVERDGVALAWRKRDRRSHGIAARQVERAPRDQPAFPVGANFAKADEDACDGLVGGDLHGELRRPCDLDGLFERRGIEGRRERIVARLLLGQAVEPFGLREADGPLVAMRNVGPASGRR